MKKLFIYLALLQVIYSCTTKPEHPNDQATEVKEKYTCPMHPSVIQDGPGQCPVCGMDLVLQKQSAANSSHLMLTDTQLRLGNITTQTVKEQNIAQVLPVNARLVANEELTEVISSRAAGRIERLFFKETGKPVRQGEPLYELYSETLLTLQKEYLLAKAQFEKLGKDEPRYESILKGTEKKLLLYGVTNEQIKNLGRNENFQPRITFVSPASGIIKEISAAEGQYVNEGALLYQIENTKQLWVEAELYPDEARYAHPGDRVSIKISGFENKEIEATVNFLSPEFRANTQVTVLRATVANSELLWKPGQSAQVFIQRAAKKAIAIPVDAVIRDERGTHVYVQTEQNTFAPRLVKTGIENFSLVEITEGLQAGEIVAVTGAYLLYSEIILKKGTDPLASAPPAHVH
jgi:membrane fusion protein, copper/silver efflux system